MDRYRLMDEEEKLLADRLEDLCGKAREDCRAYFTPFLNNKQRALAQRLLQEARDISFSFCGGFEQAERVVCAIFPDWMGEITYPIVLFKIMWKGKNELTHRDFLGAVLNLGIVRDRIGDIVVAEGGSFLAVLQGIAPYLQNNLITVGKSPVQSIEAGDFHLITAEKKIKHMSDTIASQRLDCVVGALTNCSRTEAQKLLEAQCVSVNWAITTSYDFAMRENDVVSIKGNGRYCIDSLGPQTKKGRLHIEFGKYI